MSTKIEWTDKTWNIVTGCSKISDGCKFCYAERMAMRLQAMGQENYRKGFDVALHPHKLNDPYKWKKSSMIFVVSMGDLFHRDVPFEFTHKVFVVMSNCKQHTFQVLTKRPARMQEFMNWETRQANREIDYVKLPLQNVWIGCTVVNQEEADRHIPVLLDTPAAKRFISVEPILGDMDIMRYISPDWYCERCDRFVSPSCVRSDETHDLCGEPVDNTPRLDWVVCGGESGPGARPVNPQWVRSLRDQCQAAEVPYYFKSWGEWGINIINHIAHKKYAGTMQPFTTVSSTDRKSIGKTNYWCFPEDSNDEFRNLEVMERMGKKSAGRLLDGKEYNEMPEGGK